ncbi:BglG family transcription antiterminator [Ligilactobacillus salivarius]|uniref:BglG family transcription antiterminator n=1 Tax=Ligilactobacillus salivarius TaxID=1624 RepID=UPI0009DB28F5|nr:BglG family transcription antiterminator [Ligilactobacillus salivarius]MBM6708870.1 BglG family transcription antiterminator [Ligilactobacillus salivarius]OQR07659.1 hypothetical protein B6U45_09200 [Ligilactobacillus salivarius]
MNRRDYIILNEIVKNPTIKDKYLIEKLNLTKRKLDYSIEKINDWLELNNIQPIIKKNGKYYFEKEVLKILQVTDEENMMLFHTSRERIELILLVLLTSKEKILLSKIAEELNVTKNTVLNDIKIAREDLKSYDLKIEYLRNKGYQIVGKEWSKRLVATELISKIVKSYNGPLVLKNIMAISNDEESNVRDKIKYVENMLETKFTDYSYYSLIFIIIMISRRIEIKQFIDTDYLIEVKDISDTDEYKASKFILEENKNIPDEEYIYLTLQVFSSKSIYRSILSNNIIDNLSSEVKLFLDVFEKQAATVIDNKEFLIEKLINHLIPAFYRIKYKLRTNYQFDVYTAEEFDDLYWLVEKSIYPLEDFFNQKIPENEIKFITLIVGGHILETTTEKNRNKNYVAAVVCPNGISFSQWMRSELSLMFPYMDFLPAMAIREFMKIKENNYDVVFSTVPIEADKPIYIVNQLMSKDEKGFLKKRVEKDLHIVQKPMNMKTNKLLSIIKEYAIVSDEDSLANKLEEFLSENVDTENHSDSIQLFDILRPNFINVIEKIDNWDSMIELGCKPLLENNAINNNFISNLKNNINNILDYATLAKRIALPHLGKIDGAKKIAMSLVLCRNGIKDKKGNKYYVVVFLSAPEKIGHLKAMKQLMMIAKNDELYYKLIKCKNGDEVYKKIYKNLKGGEVL